MVTPSRAQWCTSVNSKTHLSEMVSTVPAPIKDAASIQKLFLNLCTMVHFTQNRSSRVVKIDKIQ